jgi:hypothetical protein
VQSVQRVGEEVSEATAATCIGSIMDNASTNKKPQMCLTNPNNGLHIGCGSHDFALLIKDLYKGLAWVKKCYDIAVDMPNAVNNSETIAAMLKTSMLVKTHPICIQLTSTQRLWL